MNTASLPTVSPVIVLGMHRSGTSCLTGSLQDAGLFLGDVNEQAPHNRKGNRENRAIMDLNDAVMAVAGGAWDAPPDQVTWTAEQKASRDELIGCYPVDRVWGFKDPRTLFTLEGWLEALPEARCVGTFRHPIAVAKSLEKRNGFTRERSLDLWFRYNRRLLNHCQRREVLLVDFDWPVERYHERLYAIALGLQLDPSKADFAFFESQLRSNDARAEDTLPAHVADLYQALKENCSCQT